jgi:hypothetical protein
MVDEKQKEQSLELKHSGSNFGDSPESPDALEISKASNDTVVSAEHSQPPNDCEPSEHERAAGYERVVESNQRLRTRVRLSGYYRKDWIAISLVGAILFVFFSILAYSTMFSYPWQSDWGHATGQITQYRSGAKLSRSVRYTYPVGKESFNGFATFQFHGLFLWKGASVHVRFDPKVPSNSVIESGFTFATVCYSAIALICFSVVICAILVQFPQGNPVDIVALKKQSE